jgi:hypothetical protein
LEGTEGEERVHDQVELSLEPTLFGDGVVVAFTGDNDGDIWLGVKRSESGSSRRKLYDIEWFDKVGENSYELWDDGIDCWELSRFGGSTRGDNWLLLVTGFKHRSSPCSFGKLGATRSGHR